MIVLNWILLNFISMEPVIKRKSKFESSYTNRFPEWPQTFNFVKNEILTQVFSCEFCESFRITFRPIPIGVATRSNFLMAFIVAVHPVFIIGWTNLRVKKKCEWLSILYEKTAGTYRRKKRNQFNYFHLFSFPLIVNFPKLLRKKIYKKKKKKWS